MGINITIWNTTAAQLKGSVGRLYYASISRYGHVILLPLFQELP